MWEEEMRERRRHGGVRVIHVLGAPLADVKRGWRGDIMG